MSQPLTKAAFDRSARHNASCGGSHAAAMAFWKAAGPAALVRTTVGTRKQAEGLARRLVEGRLAACVHVSEVSSVYRWDGAVRQETEYLVEARTTTGRRTDVDTAMKSGHPYAMP